MSIKPNKSTIYSNINSYLGCKITDYPGGTAVIAGTTVGTNILVASPSDDSLSTRWKTSATTTPNTTNMNDGLVNTNAMATAGIALHPAGQICRNKGAQWYMPAQEEMTTFSTNLSSIGGFNCVGGTNDNCYYLSSSELTSSSVYAYTIHWPSVGRTTLGKDFSSYPYRLRCSSRF